MKLQIKLPALIPIGILLLTSVAPLSAQNSLPNPQDDSCWESLSALRACAVEEQKHALDQSERCTSYPEYQCMPASDQNASPAAIAKGTAKTDSHKKDVAAQTTQSSDSIAATATSQPPDAK